MGPSAKVVSVAGADDDVDDTGAQALALEAMAPHCRVSAAELAARYAPTATAFFRSRLAGGGSCASSLVVVKFPSTRALLLDDDAVLLPAPGAATALDSVAGPVFTIFTYFSLTLCRGSGGCCCRWRRGPWGVEPSACRACRGARRPPSQDPASPRLASPRSRTTEVSRQRPISVTMLYTAGDRNLQHFYLEMCPVVF